MAANIVNTILGIFLVYTAVLNNNMMLSSFGYIGIGAGLLIVVLSIAARRSDYHPWHSNVTAFCGVVLIALGAIHMVMSLPPLLNHWTAFWCGVLTALVALWAVLYRPLKATP